MKLPFDRARWMRDSDGEWLCLRTSNGAMARKFVDEKRDKLYDADLKEHRERRSLDANAYCWVLLGRLASHYGITPEAAYQAQIQDSPCYEVVPIRRDSAERWPSIWASNGIGFIAQNMGSSKLDGYVNFRCFYGSHVYDTKEMARLIDSIVRDCKDAGIETDTPEQLARYKEEWK